MDILDIMKARHSVRQYSGKKIEGDKREALAALDEKQACIIALGYGITQGTAHPNKPVEQLCNCASDMPDWFSRGMEAVLLAPTAMNQQKFCFTLENGKVSAKAGKGLYTNMDMGIAKYHFEAATGHKVE